MDGTITIMMNYLTMLDKPWLSVVRVWLWMGLNAYGFDLCSAMSSLVYLP